jgi:hypothetical protein
MEESESENQTSLTRDFVNVLTGAGMTMERYRTAIAEIISSDGLRNLSKQLTSFGDFIRRNQEQIHSFLVALNHLPERLEKGVGALAQRGWFVDGEMSLSFIIETAKLGLEGQKELSDTHMVSHFEDQLDNIEARLIAFAPKREHVIRSTFAAVRRGDDALAVPMLFIQADGLCHDHGLGSFFMRDRKNQTVPAAMVKISDEGLRKSPLIAPVFQVLPLYMRPDERGPSFIGLNRHLVLHGEAVDYGTHENSLKAVSFLNLISWILEKWLEEKESSEDASMTAQDHS